MHACIHACKGRLTWPDEESRMALVGDPVFTLPKQENKTTKRKQKRKTHKNNQKHKHHTAHRLFTAVLPSELICSFKI